MNGRTGIRYLESCHGWEVYAIPSHPVFTDRRGAMEALYEYQHNGTLFPTVYDILMSVRKEAGSRERP